MARSRRGGPPDLKGTLGTLIRTTLNQVGAMTGVAREAARNQKVRLDGALLERRRHNALAELGERVYELAASGQLGDLEELPEIGRALDAIEEIEQRLADDVTPAQAWGRGRGREAAPTQPYRVWRPERPAATAGADADEASSAAPALADAAAADADAADAAAPPVTGARPARRRPSRGPGGIAFVPDDADEEDLSAYMHADDLHRDKP